MNKMTDMQSKVDEAMNSVLNIGQAMPQPFFYTRLMARINRQENNYWDRVGSLISRPAFAFITVSMVLLLNIYVAFNESSPPSVNSDLSEIATADDLGANTFYDIENVQP
jgi:uncharacterized membrane protein YdfJ with MMPL/SSD domain